MKAEPPGVEIVAEVGDDLVADSPDVDRWMALATDALTDSGVLAGQLGLAFVDTATMAELNQQHMGSTGPTDVLAFPLDEPDAEATSAASGLPVLLGDVVICPEVAYRNAHEHGRTTDEELALLVVHGVLHILGMDHAEPQERNEMQARERELLERYASMNLSGNQQGPA